MVYVLSWTGIGNYEGYADFVIQFQLHHGRGCSSRSRGSLFPALCKLNISCDQELSTICPRCQKMHRGWDTSLDNANQRMWVQVSITICAVLYKMWYSPTGTLGSLLKMTLITNTKLQHRYMWQCWYCSAAGYRPCPSALFTLLDPVCDPVLWQFLWQTWIIFFGQIHWA
jgi:hypothetical protein